MFHTASVGTVRAICTAMMYTHNAPLATGERHQTWPYSSFFLHCFHPYTFLFNTYIDSVGTHERIEKYVPLATGKGYQENTGAEGEHGGGEGDELQGGTGEDVHGNAEPVHDGGALLLRDDLTM